MATSAQPWLARETVEDPAAALQASIQKYAVSSEDLQCGEYCFQLSVNFQEKVPQHLTVLLCGMGNTCGGLCTVVDVQLHKRKSVPDSMKVFGAWKRGVRDHLTNVMGDSYRKCIQYKQYGDKGLHILVKPFPEFVTLHSHIYKRHDESSILINKTSDLAILLKNKKQSLLCEAPNLPLEVGKTCSFLESEKLEFKYWKQFQLEGYQKMFTDERTTRAIVGLMNGLDGGVFVVGVEDGTNTIKGQQLDIETQVSLSEYIEDYMKRFVVLSKDASKHIMLTKGIHYEIDFKEVLGPSQSTNSSQEALRRVLIVLRFAGLEGLVCVKEPESYNVTSEGHIRRLSKAEWIQQVMLYKETIQLSETVSESNARMKKILSLTTAILKTSSSMGEKNEARDTLINEALKDKDMLSYTEERPDWANSIVTFPRHLKHRTKLLLDNTSLLKLEPSVHFTPNEETVIKSCQPIDVDSIIADIKTVCQQKHAVAIAQNCWLSLLPDQHNITTPVGHLMDVVLVTSSQDIQFWVVVSRLDETVRKKHRAYMFQTARMLKKCLLHGLCKAKPGICIGISVKCFLQGVMCQTDEGLYQDMISIGFNAADVCTTDDIREALATLLLSKDTWLKHNLSATKTIQMCGEQLEKILAFGIPCKFNLIEGPPGSGKSYMGLALNNMFPDKTLWIVPTLPFKHFLLSEGVGEVDVVTCDAEMKVVLQQRNFTDFRCLIVDDLHHFNCDSDSWLDAFGLVIRHDGLHLFMFQDNNVQNYKRQLCDVRCLMMDFCEENGIQCSVFPALTTIHRNDRKVAAFIKTNVGEEGARISCAAESEGHDVEIRRMHRIREVSESNDLVKFLKKATDPSSRYHGESKSYCATDIAILVEDKNDTIDFEKVVKTLVTEKVHNADVQPPEGITIETIDRFVGLECKMCIFVAGQPRSVLKTSANLANPRYRAFLASRAVSRAVFVVENLNCDVARTMQFGELKRHIKTEGAKTNGAASSEQVAEADANVSENSDYDEILMTEDGVNDLLYKMEKYSGSGPAPKGALCLAQQTNDGLRDHFYDMYSVVAHTDEGLVPGKVMQNEFQNETGLEIEYRQRCWYGERGGEYSTKDFSWVIAPSAQLEEYDGEDPPPNALRIQNQHAPPGEEPWYFAVAKSMHGTIPCKARSGRCFYAYDMEEHISKQFSWVVIPKPEQ